MVQHGTVVNGVIVPDGPPPPDGTRVVFQTEATADDDMWDELAKVPPPPATETREEYLQSLRDSIAEVEAGVPGLSVDEAFARVDAELRRLAEENGK